MLVEPVWTLRSVPIGDPTKALADALPTVQRTLPAGLSAVALRSFVTGHGQSNAKNCAEFCKLAHTLTLGGAPTTADVWRADCATTAAPGQAGTYKYSRAGWCPGAGVLPWTLEGGGAGVEAALTQGAPLEVSYAIADYVNTCRPDATPCSGCTNGVTCNFDGGMHTEPLYWVSAALIGFR